VLGPLALHLTPMVLRSRRWEETRGLRGVSSGSCVAVLLAGQSLLAGRNFDDEDKITSILQDVLQRLSMPYHAL
jgi:hypothetical protein